MYFKNLKQQKKKGMFLVEKKKFWLKKKRHWLSWFQKFSFSELSELGLFDKLFPKQAIVFICL